MEFLNFVLSDFYRWAGFVILILVMGDRIAEIIRAARKARKLDVHQSEGFWIVTVENPSPGELGKILSKLSHSKAEALETEEKMSK